MRRYCDIWIEPLDRRGGALHLRRADVRRGVDYLPLQVRQRDDVVIDDAQRADAGGSKIKQHRRAEAPGANDQNARAAKRRLTRTADLAQNDVARVTFKLVITQHAANIERPS